MTCGSQDEKPTREEIAERCLEIQAGWTRAEERQRRAGRVGAKSARRRWTVPVVTIGRIE